MKKNREEIENRLKGNEEQVKKTRGKPSTNAEITLLTRNGSAYPVDPRQKGYNLTVNEKTSLDQVG